MFLIVIFICLVGVFMLGRIQYLDDRFINWIGRLHNTRLSKMMILISTLGSKGFIWFCICIPLLINMRLRIVGINVILGLAIAHIAGEIIIKHLVCRVRPCHKLEDEALIVKRPRYYSFPSGHTTSSFAVLSVIALRFWPLAIPVGIIAFLMGFSRVYLRVHYLTDVICGMVLGSLCGLLSVKLLNTVFLEYVLMLK